MKKHYLIRITSGLILLILLLAGYMFITNSNQSNKIDPEALTDAIITRISVFSEIRTPGRDSFTFMIKKTLRANQEYVCFGFTDGSSTKISSSMSNQQRVKETKFVGFFEIHKTNVGKIKLGDGTFTNVSSTSQILQTCISGYGDYKYGLINNDKVKSIELLVNKKSFDTQILEYPPFFLFYIPDSSNQEIIFNFFSDKNNPIE